MPVKNPTELRLKRRSFQAWLDSESEQISLQRPTFVKSTTGGILREVPKALAPQQFRMVPFTRRLSKMTRDTPEGRITSLEHTLVGKHDADIKISDFFVHDGGKYEVESIVPGHSDRTVALLKYRGEASDESWGGK